MQNINMKFDSMGEFIRYIKTTPYNSAFGCKKKYSNVQKGNCGNDFYYTNDFDSAINLAINGWTDAAIKITNAMNFASKTNGVVLKPTNIYSMAGYQCSVPRYLNGIPDSMIAKKMVTKKEKVITLVKSIGFNCQTSADKILKYSAKALQIVERVEQLGYAVNLDIVWCSVADGQTLICRVRVKKSNERLNVCKIAFPIANPDMLRRCMLRFAEVEPNVGKGFVVAYGKSITDDKIMQDKLNLQVGEYYLHNIIDSVDSYIKENFTNMA